MGKLLWTASTAAVLVAVVACSDTGMTPDAPQQGLQASWSPFTGSAGVLLQSRLDGLAAGVAEAARDAGVRDELFRAFQASRKPEGKVHLHAVAGAGTATGHRLAARFGPVGGLDRALQDLPSLDFSIGRRQDRVAWRPGAATVAVVAVADPDQRSATAYFSDGRVEVVGGPDDVRADVLFLIHPTEQTLDDDCDPEIAIIPCEEYGGGYSSGDPTWVDEFEVNFGDWWGSSEVEFRGDGYCGTTLQAWGKARITEVDPYTLYGAYVDYTMIPGWSLALCGGNGKVYVGLYETDPFDDDYYGTALWYQNERGAGRYFVLGDPNGYATVSWTIP